MLKTHHLEILVLLLFPNIFDDHYIMFISTCYNDKNSISVIYTQEELFPLFAKP